MKILYHRFPLFAGLLLLQAPTPAGGLSMSDQVLIVILNAPAYALISLLFWQFLKMQREENARRASENLQRSQDEARRDQRDDKLIDVVVNSHQRIDEIEKDRSKNEESRRAQWELMTQALNNSTAMVSALDNRSAFLLQSDKEISESQGFIRAEVKTMFDRLMIVFPTEKSIDTLFSEFKAVVLDEFEKAYEKKKGDSQPITLPQDINVTLHTQPDPAPDAAKPDTGEAAA